MYIYIYNFPRGDTFYLLTEEEICEALTTPCSFLSAMYHSQNVVEKLRVDPKAVQQLKFSKQRRNLFISMLCRKGISSPFSPSSSAGQFQDAMQVGTGDLSSSHEKAANMGQRVPELIYNLIP